MSPQFIPLPGDSDPDDQSGEDTPSEGAEEAAPRSIDEVLGDHEDRLRTLHETTTAHASNLKVHRKALDTLANYLETRPGGPWSWRTLPPEAAKKLWEDLYDWVNWLDDRYLRNLGGQSERIITDWYRHPVAVELLTALMVSHQSAYRRAKSAPSFDLVDWHERCLFPTFARMRQLNLFPDIALDKRWDGPKALPNHRDDPSFDVFVTEAIKQQPPAPEKPGRAGSTTPTPTAEPGHPATVEFVPYPTDADAPPVEGEPPPPDDWGDRV